MQGQKSHSSHPRGGGWFNRELKLILVFFGLISFCNFILVHDTSALFEPSISVSIDNSNYSINATPGITSNSESLEMRARFIVSTNLESGFSAYINTEGSETALVNQDSANQSKIKSIDSKRKIESFANNTWGYRDLRATSFYSPIPKQNNPDLLFDITNIQSYEDGMMIERKMQESIEWLSFGMKLGSTLESGRYSNKVIISVVTNPYRKRAKMTTGIDFNTKIKTFETGGNRIEYIARSTTAPSLGLNTVSLEDEVNSDYEIKAWYDAATKTVYYYTDAEKIILNIDSNAMFHSLVNLTSLDVSSFDTSKVKGMGNMFFGDEKLTSLDLSNFDTQSLTNMDKMFYGLSSLTNLNIGSFDTSKVTNMDSLFYGMVNIENINVSNFDTRNVTNMNHMFSSMHKLKQLQLPATFNTSNVTDMGYMFYNSKSLTSLDVSMFNTEKVTNMREMFGYLESVTSIKFGSSFNTKNVTDMYGMFGTLCRIRELDLSGAVFDTAKVNDFDAMFSVFGCTSGVGMLEKIYVNNDFDLTSAKTYKASNPTSNLDIFHKQPLLRGAMGSYWANPGDANFDGLRIDRAGVKGYFTRKP